VFDSAQRAGFVTLVRSGLVLTLGQEATVNLTLRVAGVAETVTVTAESPLVETTSNALERTITRTELDTLPLVGRNFANLTTMSPGIAGVGGGGVSASGQTTRSNSYIIDGTSNDDTVVNTQRGGFSLEAVREFAVITNQFNAEYGMASEAIVNVITRSGTNDLQGRVFAFHRDDSFDVLVCDSKGSRKAQPDQSRELPVAQRQPAIGNVRPADADSRKPASGGDRNQSRFLGRTFTGSTGSMVRKP
jgi:hypothetical protein